MRSLVRSVTPTWALNIVRKQFGTRYMRRLWLDRKHTDADNFIEKYWNDRSANRTQLAQMITQRLADDASVLDYGSFVGVILRLVKETAGSKAVSCFAVEPNHDAVSILREKMPDVRALEGDDEAFTKASFPDRNVDVSLANSVFNTMSYDRSAAVLDRLCKISTTVIIGDSVQNIDGRASRISLDPVMHQHPFRKMLADRGFRNVEIIPAPEPKPQLEAWIVASRS